MDKLHQHELEFIIALQKSVAAAKVMGWISYFGWELFVVLVPCIYLGLSRRLGAPLIVLYLVNYASNNLAKIAFQSPRPYWMLDSVQPWAQSVSYGLPSGHAQMAFVGWLTAAWLFRNSIIWLIASGMVLAVSFSRIYLGVHFISDIAAGWLLGSWVLLSFVRLAPQWAKWVSRKSTCAQLGIAAAASAGVLLFGLTTYHVTTPTGTVASWASFAVDARDRQWLFGDAGALLGAGVGLSMVQRWLGFDMRESLIARTIGLLYACGTGLLLVLFGRQVSSSWMGWEKNLADFVRFALTAWVLTFQAPWSVEQLHRRGAFLPHPFWLKRSTLARNLQIGTAPVDLEPSIARFNRF